mmetsp:Transcript_51423/g.103304  ORF Transcript_51423/g.103304 Transcript_51423/m.103304 type:complete len:218 (+) Transcript_51423:325-978(+)
MRSRSAAGMRTTSSRVQRARSEPSAQSTPGASRFSARQLPDTTSASCPLLPSATKLFEKASPTAMLTRSFIVGTRQRKKMVQCSGWGAPGRSSRYMSPRRTWWKRKGGLVTRSPDASTRCMSNTCQSATSKPVRCRLWCTDVAPLSAARSPAGAPSTSRPTSSTPLRRASPSRQNSLAPPPRRSSPTRRRTRLGSGASVQSQSEHTPAVLHAVSPFG